MDLESLGPGDVLADKFRLDSLLGQGGMGSVWRAHHLSLNSPVALKLIDPSLAVHPDARARFMREAQAAAALRSPHVVQTFDFGLHDDIPFIAMELLEGETLADRLDRERTISPALTAHVMTHVARAMSKAHDAGIVHRDLKPDNVFLVHNEDEEIAKVLDFGVAKATGATSLESDSKTRTGALLGTPYYMSPEQAQGDKTVDWRSDLWSMAIITYECLLGHRPFDSDGLGNLLVQICVAPIPVPSQRGSVPAGFDAWFARATQRDPALRPQSARELARTLREALTGALGRASQTSSPAFDASGRPLDAGSYPGIDSNSTSGVDAGSHPGVGSQSGGGGSGPAGLAAGSQPGLAVATTGLGGEARMTTGGVAAAEVEGDPVTIPKKSSVGLVLVLLAVLLVVGGGAAFAVTAIGGGAGAEPAGPADASAEVASAERPPLEDPKIEPAEVSSAVSSASASASAVATKPPPAAPVPAARPRPRVVATSRPVTPTPTPAPTSSPRSAPPRATSPPPATPPRRDRLGF
jgi:serine/threonine protein kinase